MIRLLRAADYRSMPWKNGGGVTTEIAVHPEGAGLDSFDWRVSMARVETDGPFSNFPGMDRVLAVLDGEGIILSVEGRTPVVLTGTSDPLPFPADISTSCRLIGGPITDLNVMVRRGRIGCGVHRVMIEDEYELAADADLALIFCVHGAAVVSSANEQIALEQRDCALANRNASPFSLRPKGKAELIIAELRQIVAAEQ